MARADQVEAGQVGPDKHWPDASSGGGLFEPALDAVLLQAMDRLYLMDYKAADSLLSGLPPGPARDYFRGLVELNRFGDLGDTSALTRAGSIWENLDRMHADTESGSVKNPAYTLYRGLSVLQLSYIASVTGSPVRSARLGRKAVGLLRPHARNAEAAAALALYEYYKASLLKGVAWMPFIEADKSEPLRRLESAIPRSRYLGEILQTSLLWLYYDAGRYGEGLERIDAFLLRYPRNRPYRQIRADFLYRQGALDSARAIHEALLREYQDLAGDCPIPSCLPIGYLASVGNLAKIHATANRPELLRKHVEIWRSSQYEDILKWMPASLVREVSALPR